jgi:hypothetical protein
MNKVSSTGQINEEDKNIERKRKILERALSGGRKD